MATSIMPCTLEDMSINQYGQGYIKFSNGTMIIMETCSVPLSTKGGKPYYKYGTNNDNWPDDSGGFIDSNIAAVVTTNMGEIQHYNFSLYNITSTGYTVSMGGPDNTSTFWPRIMAIGRWKEAPVYYRTDLLFNGTSDYIDTGIKLFSAENINRDFLITMVIGKNNTSNTSGHHNILTAMREVSPYPGFVYRRQTDGNLYLVAGVNVTYGSFPVGVINETYYLRRINGVYSYASGSEPLSWQTMTVRDGTFNEPLILGAGLDSNGNPFRYWAGVITSIRIEWL